MERAGVPVEVDTRKALALLAYLAVTERSGSSHTSYTRDALAAFFWPDYDQSGARAALRRTLSALRKAVGEDLLEVSREVIGLSPTADLWVDVSEFRRLLAEGRTHGHSPAEVCATCLVSLEQAADLYRDDFMAGFSLRDAPAFDDWHYFQSETLRRELAQALEKVARGHAAHGAFETAIAYARRWLALDPLREEAHRSLMQLYAWAGQREAALRQYRECVRVLDQELRVAPLDETIQLAQAIKENRLPLPAITPVPAAITVAPPVQATIPTRPTAYPLIGRAQEWAQLVQVYEQVGPGGRFVALEGEAGIGKTRLAEAFLAYVRQQGAAVITARCYEGETHLAYGPFIEALRAAIGGRLIIRQGEKPLNMPDHVLSEVARLLPELALLHPDLPPAPPLEGPGAQSRFFEAVAHVVAGDSPDGSPTVLFLDDLHWADSASLDLLTYLAQRCSRGYAPGETGRRDKASRYWRDSPYLIPLRPS